MHRDRPAFLGTAGYGPLDNVSVLERFEALDLAPMLGLDDEGDDDE